MSAIDDAPQELSVAIREFWPQAEWDNAAAVSRLESLWDAFAVDDTRDADHPCGAVLRTVTGVIVSAEHSVGYFQINVCNLPSGWEWQRLYNARHNAGTAHMLWVNAGQSWSPWYFTAKQLGLL